MWETHVTVRQLIIALFLYIATFYFYHSNTLVVLSNIWITEGIIIGWFLLAQVRGAPVILLNIVLLKLAEERVGILVVVPPSFIIFGFLPLDFLFESILVRNLGFKGGYFLLLRLGSRELYLKGSNFLAVRDCIGSPSFNIMLSSMLLRVSPPLTAWLLLAFVFYASSYPSSFSWLEGNGSPLKIASMSLMYTFMRLW